MNVWSWVLLSLGSQRVVLTSGFGPGILCENLLKIKPEERLYVHSGTSEGDCARAKSVVYVGISKCWTLRSFSTKK